MQVLLVEDNEGPGRPTKLDEHMAARICQGLSDGLSNQETADLVGINVDTLYEWFKIEAFAKRVAGAKATRKQQRLRLIGETWQGAAWILERSDPQAWGRHLLFQRAETGEKDVTEVSLVKALSDYNALHNGKKSQVIEAQGSSPEPG